jgi:ribosome maturation factor RimP
MLCFQEVAMATLSQIEAIIFPIIESKGAFLVDISMRNDRDGKLLEIFVDTDKGITTSQCADISRELSSSEELDNLFRQQYHLVVSSPGIDRPLKFARQYRKNVGRTMKIQVRGDGKADVVEGELVDTDEQGITVRTGNGELCTVPFPSIIETRVVAVW